MTIANLRSWLATAKPTWTLPLARPEVEALLAERDGLVEALRDVCEIAERAEHGIDDYDRIQGAIELCNKAES